MGAGLVATHRDSSLSPRSNLKPILFSVLAAIVGNSITLHRDVSKGLRQFKSIPAFVAAFSSISQVTAWVHSLPKKPSAEKEVYRCFFGMSNKVWIAKVDAGFET